MQLDQIFNRIARSFSRIARQARRDNIVCGIWAAFRQWNEMILSKPIHPAIAIDTAMIESIFDGVPFGSGKCRRERSFNRTATVRGAFHEIKMPFARLLLRPFTKAFQFFCMIAVRFTVNTVAFQNSFAVQLAIFGLLLSYLISMQALVLFAISQMSFFMRFIVLFASLILLIPSIIPPILVALAQQFGVFAPMSAGITRTAQAMRAAIVARSQLSTFIAIHSLIIPPLARGYK